MVLRSLNYRGKVAFDKETNSLFNKEIFGINNKNLKCNISSKMPITAEIHLTAFRLSCVEQLSQNIIQTSTSKFLSSILFTPKP